MAKARSYSTSPVAIPSSNSIASNGTGSPSMSHDVAQMQIAVAAPDIPALAAFEQQGANVGERRARAPFEFARALGREQIGKRRKRRAFWSR